MIFKQKFPVKAEKLYTGTSSLDTKGRKGLALIMCFFSFHMLYQTASSLIHETKAWF